MCFVVFKIINISYLIGSPELIYININFQVFSGSYVELSTLSAVRALYVIISWTYTWHLLYFECKQNKHGNYLVWNKWRITLLIAFRRYKWPWWWLGYADLKFLLLRLFYSKSSIIFLYTVTLKEPLVFAFFIIMLFHSTVIVHYWGFKIILSEFDNNLLIM